MIARKLYVPVFFSTVLSSLILLDNEVVSPLQLGPDLLVARGVKEEDAAAEDAVEDGERPVERDVLLVLREDADDVADEDERHDDQVGALHDLGRDELLLVQSGEAAVVGGAGRLDHREDKDHLEKRSHSFSQVPTRSHSY